MAIQTQRRGDRKKSDGRIIRLQIKDRMGHARWITADLLNTSEHGLGVMLMTPVAAGSQVSIRGNIGDDRPYLVSSATVKWCTEKINGNFHAGLEVGENLAGAETSAQKQQPHSAREAAGSVPGSGTREAAGSAPGSGNGSADATAHGPAADFEPVPTEVDWYEVMQLSPNADPDTIARVYRILAQRYHPDSATGNQEMFLRLCEAHRVLIDPALRAQYDAQHRETRRLRWRIFDRAALTRGPGEEFRKRRGILEALYAKALHDPERASLTIFDLEELLGCPREHLEAALWYLRGKGQLKRGDNGRFTITISGFDEVEAASRPHQPPAIHPELKQLEAAVVAEQ